MHTEPEIVATLGARWRGPSRARVSAPARAGRAARRVAAQLVAGRGAVALASRRRRRPAPAAVTIGSDLTHEPDNEIAARVRTRSAACWSSTSSRVRPLIAPSSGVITRWRIRSAMPSQSSACGCASCGRRRRYAFISASSQSTADRASDRDLRRRRCRSRPAIEIGLETEQDRNVARHLRAPRPADCISSTAATTSGR